MNNRSEALRSISPTVWLPPTAALAYPFILMLFHSLVGPVGSAPGITAGTLTAATLISTLAAPVLGMYVAHRADIPVRMRRMAYACAAAPTLYVFLGVVQTLLGSALPDPVVWCVLWLALMFWSTREKVHARPPECITVKSRWRVAHGISAVILCLYVFFHLGNHLMGLMGADQHAAVMNAGRSVYRSTVIEPVLVAAFLFQVGSGLYLAWQWSRTRHDLFRTFQIASGLYLSVFILGHMNSVFIYARTYLGIPTDWNFAIGAPAGLINDPWNIRLVPHYWLGVFFVLSHLVAGLRLILLAHGVSRQTANRVSMAGFALSGGVAIAIIAAMCGVRL